MENSKLRYHDLLVVMVWEIQTIYELFKDDQKYECLLQELAKYDIDDRSPLPYQKELLKSLDMSRTQLMNLMHNLYDDFKNELSKPKAYQILDSHVTLSVETRDEHYWSIGLNGLKFIPHKGETFTIPFIRSEYSWRNFQVQRVAHELEKGIHYINIFLNDTFAIESNK